MKRTIISLIALAILVGAGLGGCKRDDVQKVLQLLSDGEISQGLKEALSIGATQAIGIASKDPNVQIGANQKKGFWESAIQFPLPKEIDDLQKFMKNQEGHDDLKGLIKGLIGDEVGTLHKRLHEGLNHAAERASGEVLPIFKASIKDMNIIDAVMILKGGDTAATEFLRRSSQAELSEKFSEKVKNALGDDVPRMYGEVSALYNDNISAIRALGFNGPEKMETKLEDFVTEKALDGLFTLLGQEERKIRANPRAYGSDIIQKVFTSELAGWHGE